MKIYMNGELLDKKDAKVSVFDHGYLYGDGVFEGIRIYHGKVFKLKEHIDRLYDSAKAIMLDIPISKEEMIQATLTTCKENNLYDKGYIRLIVSRGVGDLGLNALICKEPMVVIIASTISLYPEEFYEKGFEIITVPTRRNISEALNPRIKSLNYLNNVLAKIEALHCGYQEAVMINQQGYVSECTGDNIFYIKDNVIITPCKSMGILEGITRNVVIELAQKEGLEVREEVFTRYSLYTADECFLTGSAAEVVPVINIDGRVIGEGKVGLLTKKIISLFGSYVKEQGQIIPS